MNKFRFRLETLLQHRRNIEEKERTKFSRIRVELSGEINRRDSLLARQAEALSELAQTKTTDCNSQEISWFYCFLSRLDRELKRSAVRIVELEKQLEAQRQAMVAASRDKKMIENLRRKKQKEFLVSLEREDQKAIDDMAVTRFAWRQ